MVLVMSRSMNATGNIGRLWWNACRISKFWRCASDFWNKIFSDFSLPFASFCFHSFDLFVCFPQPRHETSHIHVQRSAFVEIPPARPWRNNVTTTMQKRCVNDANLTYSCSAEVHGGAPRWCAVEPPRCQTALASLRKLREDVSTFQFLLLCEVFWNFVFLGFSLFFFDFHEVMMALSAKSQKTSTWVLTMPTL